jgi:hypothetical protein
MTSVRMPSGVSKNAIRRRPNAAFDHLGLHQEPDAGLPEARDLGVEVIDLVEVVQKPSGSSRLSRSS